MTSRNVNSRRRLVKAVFDLITKYRRRGGKLNSFTVYKKIVKLSYRGIFPRYTAINQLDNLTLSRFQEFLQVAVSIEVQGGFRKAGEFRFNKNGIYEAHLY